MSTWEAVLTKAAERDHRLFLTEKTPKGRILFHQVTKEEYESTYGGPKESIATEPVGSFGRIYFQRFQAREASGTYGAINNDTSNTATTIDRFTVYSLPSNAPPATTLNVQQQFIRNNPDLQQVLAIATDDETHQRYYEPSPERPPSVLRDPYPSEVDLFNNQPGDDMAANDAEINEEQLLTSNNGGIPSSLVLSEHPPLELLENTSIHRAGLLKARIDNVRSALLRNTAKAMSGFPAFLVTAPVIAAPCTHLFKNGYFTDVNKILLDASKSLSDRTNKELERIRIDLEGEYQVVMDDWTPSEEEEKAILAVATMRTDQAKTFQDRPPITNTDFLIRPDPTKGHTLITPNPELRALNKTTNRIPGPRRDRQPANHQQQHPPRPPHQGRPGYSSRNGAPVSRRGPSNRDFQVGPEQPRFQQQPGFHQHAVYPNPGTQHPAHGLPAFHQPPRTFRPSGHYGQ